MHWAECLEYAFIASAKVRVLASSVVNSDHSLAAICARSRQICASLLHIESRAARLASLAVPGDMDREETGFPIREVDAAVFGFSIFAILSILK
jgi:hypothetical protein